MIICAIFFYWNSYKRYFVIKYVFCRAPITDVRRAREVSVTWVPRQLDNLHQTYSMAIAITVLHPYLSDGVKWLGQDLCGKYSYLFRLFISHVLKEYDLIEVQNAQQWKLHFDRVDLGRIQLLLRCLWIWFTENPFNKYTYEEEQTHY